MAELTTAGYAPETVARTIRWVKLTLNQAVRDRHIVFSPADGLRLPKPRRTDNTVWTTEAGGFLRRGTLEGSGAAPLRISGETVPDPRLCRPRHNHDLRHTHAAWLIAAGEHPKTIQTRLGHSSIQVTIDRYGRLMDGLDYQTASRLDAIAAAVHERDTNKDPLEIAL